MNTALELPNSLYTPGVKGTQPELHYRHHSLETQTFLMDDVQFVLLTQAHYLTQEQSVVTILQNGYPTSGPQHQATSRHFGLMRSPQQVPVILKGEGNITILLQATQSNKLVGSWSQGNESCNGRPLFFNPFPLRNGTLTAYWTSPMDGTSVQISALISNVTLTFGISATLVPARNTGSYMQSALKFSTLILSLGFVTVISKLL
ncbi:uncharacterized protein LOC128638266 [Bombina bombina]|uniref:uncharacterized protein LOC128638266 n=1 Tax=Bombina bombina TaxID=8345 RepID=UPI00235AFCB5|nr:uncharacterized protein LOC128638266 [Bombina bombina]XP_053546106.1 uncharacterized protein LOC128638266 [Bombina bombina]